MNPNFLLGGFRSVNVGRANTTSLEKVPPGILKPITGRGCERQIGATVWRGRGRCGQESALKGATLGTIIPPEI